MLYEFVSEAKEHLANFGDDLLALEKNVESASRFRIDRLFRAVHSVKGGAAFCGCKAIEKLAHALETVLDQMRRGRSQPDGAVIDSILAGIDFVQTLLDDIEDSDNKDVEPLCKRLREFILPDEPIRPTSAALALPAPPEPMFEITEELLRQRPPDHRFLYALHIDLAGHLRERNESPREFLTRLSVAGIVLDARMEVPETDLSTGLPEGPIVYQALFSSHLPPERLVATTGLPAGQWRELAVPFQSAIEPVPPPKPIVVEPVPRASETIRINVPLLDQLMRLAGELVLVRNQALQTVSPSDIKLRPIMQRLNGVTSELQEAVMRTRMQPVGNLLGKFPRMVRDLAKQLGKEIELILGGTEVELDKTIMEALSDPLTHLIRNCCDHGIEPVEIRNRSGKAAQGQVCVRAHHEGGQIRIEVRDDGRGIDPEVLRRKALQIGLRTVDELERMSERETLALILLPGFSTAGTVTDVSGRGVGMDVVRANLEALGGSLEIESVVGKGSVFHLRVPLTLAIIPCLIVVVEGERYAIPQKHLEELICLQGERARQGVEVAHHQEMYRLRERLLPLVRLIEVLDRPIPFSPATRAEFVRSTSEPESLSIAVVKVGGQRFGLVVDRILNSEEVVVKPMHGLLKSLRCFSGATIMGDGRVALILDVEGIARHAGVFHQHADEPIIVRPNLEVEKDQQAVLLFKHGPEEQFAMALPMIRRIEMMPATRIERVGDKEYVNIDGTATLLMRLDRHLPVSPCPNRSMLFVLLPRNLRLPIGLLVSEIIDTETLTIELQTAPQHAPGILGSAMVRGRMTLFLDVFQLADYIDSAGAEKRPALVGPRGKRILLVEDTQFFRELVKSYLEADGFEVDTAVNGALGLAKLREKDYDMVVSDIEMPVMDGWNFARAVREKLGRRDLPMLALTTLSSDRDKAKAFECGFDEYEVKLDREQFRSAVSRLVSRPKQ